MKTRRKLAGLLAALLLLALLPPAQDAGLVPTAHAVTQKEIDNLKDDAKGLKSERQDIESQLSKLKNDKNDAIKKRNLLDDQIAVTVREIENIASQISGYEALLEQTAYELEVNQQQEADQYELFCNRARAMEKSGTTSYWAVLFKASSFSDLLSRLSDIQAVMNYDQSVLDELRRIHVEIEEKHAYQEQLKTEAEQAKAEQEAKKVELDGQRKAADDLVKELQANEEIAAALLAEKEAEEKRIQEAIKKKEKELEEQMRAAQMNWTATAGGYIWPENASKKITSLPLRLPEHRHPGRFHQPQGRRYRRRRLLHQRAGHQGRGGHHLREVQLLRQLRGHQPWPRQYYPLRPHVQPLGEGGRRGLPGAGHRRHRLHGHLQRAPSPLRDQGGRVPH